MNDLDSLKKEKKALEETFVSLLLFHGKVKGKSDDKESEKESEKEKEKEKEKENEIGKEKEKEKEAIENEKEREVKVGLKAIWRRWKSNLAPPRGGVFADEEIFALAVLFVFAYIPLSSSSSLFLSPSLSPSTSPFFSHSLSPSPFPSPLPVLFTSPLSLHRIIHTPACSDAFVY